MIAVVSIACPLSALKSIERIPKPHPRKAIFDPTTRANPAKKMVHHNIAARQEFPENNQAEIAINIGIITAVSPILIKLTQEIMSNIAFHAGLIREAQISSF